jgi:hypothetical protein
MIVRHQPDNLAAFADHDLGIKGKPACQFSAECRPSDWPPDHEGASRADVDNIEMLQLVDERTRSEAPVAANVHPSQQNHERHEFLLLASRENSGHVR